MHSKRAFDNWYFLYSEAEREFLEAKRSFEVKKRDVGQFLFGAYSEWSKRRYGLILRPHESVDNSERETAADFFCSDLGVDPVSRAKPAEILSQVFLERERQV